LKNTEVGVVLKVDGKQVAVCGLAVVSVAGMGHGDNGGQSTHQQHVDSQSCKAYFSCSGAQASVD